MNETTKVKPFFGFKNKLRATFNQKIEIKGVFMVMVLIMWAISFLFDMVNPSYDPPEYINPLIMLVGGFLLAATNTSNNKDGHGKK